MCAPIMPILQIGSAIAGVVAQQQAASAQETANRRQYENTIRTMNANLSQTNLMMEQEREGATQALMQNNAQARAAQSRAVAAASSAGISGLSVDALLGDMQFKQNEYNSSVMTNLDRKNAAIQNQRENVYADAASTINGLRTPAMPDYFGAGLKIYGSGKDAGWWGK